MSGVEVILSFVFIIMFMANLIGSMIMYLGGLGDELDYVGYDYPNPLSVRCIFTYWWNLTLELPINILGQIILMVLMTIIFSPMIIIHFVFTLLGFIALCFCKAFVRIFGENEEKKMLRQAKRELKRLKKGDK